MKAEKAFITLEEFKAGIARAKKRIRDKWKYRAAMDAGILDDVVLPKLPEDSDFDD